MDEHMDAHEDRRHRTVRLSVLILLAGVLFALTWIGQGWRVGGLIERTASAAADSAAARMQADVVQEFGARIDSLGTRIDSLGPRVDSLWRVMVEGRNGP